MDLFGPRDTLSERRADLFRLHDTLSVRRADLFGPRDTLGERRADLFRSRDSLSMRRAGHAHPPSLPSQRCRRADRAVRPLRAPLRATRIHTRAGCGVGGDRGPDRAANVDTGLNVAVSNDVMPTLGFTYYFTDNIAKSFLNYAVAGAVLQGVLFGSTSAAGDLATDIEQGFFERLLASPISRTAIVLGRLAGSMVVAVVQVVIFLTIFLVAGARVESGPIGYVGLIGGGAFLALAMSGLMAGLAIKSGSPEVVQGAFPLVFVLMFLSSAFFPRHYMKGWYRTVADWNPLSHIVEGMQGFMNHDLSASQFAKSWLLPLVIAIISIAFSLRALSNRLAAS